MSIKTSYQCDNCFKSLAPKLRIQIICAIIIHDPVPGKTKHYPNDPVKTVKKMDVDFCNSLCVEEYFRKGKYAK